VSTPETAVGIRWRVFPWDEYAAPGGRFSPSFVANPTGRGRFDLPRDLSGCLYLADSPDHAVGEVIQPWRGQPIGVPHLVRGGHRLALVRVTLAGTLEAELADLCDPRVLSEKGIRPDKTASRHRVTTQPLARQAWHLGASGLRWWSRFWGDWHTTVLFTARAADRIEFDHPVTLTLEEPAVQQAAELLGIRIVA
jgi:hypothetical protein